jgi:hypothetical protein
LGAGELTWLKPVPNAKIKKAILAKIAKKILLSVAMVYPSFRDVEIEFCPYAKEGPHPSDWQLETTRQLYIRKK